jgi:hypothetical protein
MHNATDSSDIMVKKVTLFFFYSNFPRQPPAGDSQMDTAEHQQTKQIAATKQELCI